MSFSQQEGAGLPFLALACLPQVRQMKTVSLMSLLRSGNR